MVAQTEMSTGQSVLSVLLIWSFETINQLTFFYNSSTDLNHNFQLVLTIDTIYFEN